MSNQKSTFLEQIERDVILRSQITAAALKRTLLVGFRIPWSLTPQEDAVLEGLTNDEVARIVVEELAGGAIDSSDAKGVFEFIRQATMFFAKGSPCSWAELVSKQRVEIDALKSRLAVRPAPSVN